MRLRQNAFGKARGLAFPKQDAFVSDPARFLTAQCTRRAGKSNGLARRYLRTMQKYHRCLCVYLALTRDSAKNIMWEMLKEHTEEEKIKAEFTEHNLTMTLVENGSRLQLFGADMKNFIRRLKGIKTPGAGIDECFHPDTLVMTIDGEKKISEIHAGDHVLNAVGYGLVTNVTKKAVSETVELRYSSRTIRCSGNHPFLSLNGWTNASELNGGDFLVAQSFSMWLLQQNISKRCWPYLSFLQSTLLREVVGTKSKTSRSLEISECHVLSSSCPENEEIIKRHWSSSEDSWWEWASTNDARTNADDSYARIKMELCDFLGDKRKRIPSVLQGGFGVADDKVSDRNRRPISWFKRETSTGYQKDEPHPIIRVDSVEIQKSRGNNESRDNYFYDLSVQGHPSFSVNGALVHNCQDFGSHIMYLVDDVLTPATIDYPDGWLALTGTPGPIPHGYFYEVTALGKYGFSRHEWSIYDNPYIDNAEGFVNELIAKKQWEPDNPTLLREWRNKWVLDLDALVYKYNKEKNHYDHVDHSRDWEFVVGVDIGFDDADAIAVLGWHKNKKLCYLIEEHIHREQTITDLAARIDAVIAKYNPLKVVMDTGGLGKKIAEEMRRRYTLPIVAAEKTRKFEFIELLNDAMRMGRFFAKSTSQFADDCTRIKWETDIANPEKPKISENYHSDINDAVLYAYRESLHWLSEPAKDKLVPQTEPWFQAQAKEAEQILIEKLEREQSSNIWDDWEGDKW